MLSKFLSGASPAPKAKTVHPNDGLRRREALVGLALLSPWLLGYVLLKIIPILTALWFSLTDFELLHPADVQFVGLANYVHFLTDRAAWANLVGSLGYFLTTVPLELFVALGLATILSSERLRGKSLMRLVIFMPSIIPASAIFFIWLGFVDPGSGWLNRLFMQPLGLPPIMPGPDGNPPYLVTIMSLWSIGPGFLIMYGAMQGVSRELHEAALIDGAGPLMRLLNITLPIISPAIFFSLVINLTSAFGGSVLLDRGFLFSESLSPMEGYINTVMFSELHLGYAAALAWVMFAVTMTITIVLFRSAQRWVYFPEEGTREAF